MSHSKWGARRRCQCEDKFRVEPTHIGSLWGVDWWKERSIKWKSGDSAAHRRTATEWINLRFFIIFFFFLPALEDVLARLLFTRLLEIFALRDKKFLSIISAENLSRAARQRRTKKVFSFLCSQTQKTITKLIRKTRARDYELTWIRVFSDRFVRQS